MTATPAVRWKHDEWMPMIPILLLFGLIFGRQWKVAIPLAAVGWPVVLVLTDSHNASIGLIWVGLLAAANTGVGALIRLGVDRALRLLRR